MGAICWLAVAASAFVASLAAGGAVGTVLIVSFALGCWIGALLWFLMIGPSVVSSLVLGIWFRRRPGSVRALAIGSSPLLALLPTWLAIRGGVSPWVACWTFGIALVYGAVARAPRRYFVGRPLTAAG